RPARAAGLVSGLLPGARAGRFPTLHPTPISPSWGALGLVISLHRTGPEALPPEVAPALPSFFAWHDSPSTSGCKDHASVRGFTLVGRTPWSGRDAPVPLFGPQADECVGRGPRGLPYFGYHKLFAPDDHCQQRQGRPLSP